MSRAVSERMRKNLSMSLPLVRANKELLIELMERHLRPTITDEEPVDLADISAMILAEMLLDRVVDLVERGELSNLGEVIPEHRSLGITGRQYSRFGDALVPVLKDIAGPNLPPEVAGAWCDTFWAIIRTAQNHGQEAFA